jgi:hypothetical protein
MRGGEMWRGVREGGVVGGAFVKLKLTKKTPSIAIKAMEGEVGRVVWRSMFFILNLH